VITNHSELNLYTNLPLPLPLPLNLGTDNRKAEAEEEAEEEQLLGTQPVCNVDHPWVRTGSDARI